MNILPAFPELFIPKTLDNDSADEKDKEKEDRSPVEIFLPAIKVISPPFPDSDSTNE